MFRFRLSETIFGRLVAKWDTSSLADKLTPIGSEENMPMVWAALSGIFTFAAAWVVTSILNGSSNGAIVTVSLLIGLVAGANMHSREFRESLRALIVGRSN